MKKGRCVRCEALERKQKSKKVHEVNSVLICDYCLQEIAEEEEFIKRLTEEGEDDEQGGEGIN